MLIDRLQNAPTMGERITFYRAFLNIAATEKARSVLKVMLKGGNPSGSEGVTSTAKIKNTLPTGLVSASVPLRVKDRFEIVTRLLILGDHEAPKLLAALEKTETGDEAKRYAYAAKAGIATADGKAKYWTDYTTNKEISESWIEASLGPFNSLHHSEVTLKYLDEALAELPNLKRTRKIFFINNWLAAFIGGQRSEEALAIVNKFLADNPKLDNDLRLKILENVDLIERAVKIRAKYAPKKT
jgi:aminopeptidase N